MAEPRKIVAWGGFTDGKLMFSMVDDGFGGENFRLMPAIFTTRREAKRQFEDVRKIEIRQVPR